MVVLRPGHADDARSCCSCGRAIRPRRPGPAGAPASRARCATSAPTPRSPRASSTPSWPRSSAGAEEIALPVRARAGAGRARGAAARRACARPSGAGTRAPVRLVDARLTLHEMRLIKSPDEVAIQRRAAEITAEAHIAAMRARAPGAQRVRDRGAHRLHVPQARRHRARLPDDRRRRRQRHHPPLRREPRAAGGRAAAARRRRLRDRRLHRRRHAHLPRSARASRRPQRRLYEVVLEAQIAAIEAVKPGATLDAIHEQVVERLTRQHGRRSAC